MADSKQKVGKKPPKPYPDFPLFAHVTARRAKRLKGPRYSWPWRDANRGLKKYLDQKNCLYADLDPVAQSDGFTMADLYSSGKLAPEHIYRFAQMSYTLRRS